jgi:lipopolysaccharide transport system ATP-binding protein
MSSEIAVHAQGLAKVYPIFRRPQDRLKQMLVRGRKRYYEEYWALQNVDLEVHRGETLGLIGRNGSGKSTLLQLICGTLSPSLGEVTTRGRVAAMLELGAGFNPEFTGRENVHLAASVLGLSHDQIRNRFEAIAAFAGIGDFMEQPVKIYSSGMYARLAFAVAAHVDADILIVDEILAVGDAAFAQKCMKFIRGFRQNGTLLLASHDVGTVLNLCDRALWLDRGSVRESGVTRDVCDDYVAVLHSETDSGQQLSVGGRRRRPPERSEVISDPRAEALKASLLHNRIEVFDFDPDAAWHGRRGATIESVAMFEPSGQPLAQLSGGEEVVLRISGSADLRLERPIIGFYIKDRLGQQLFGDNTYLTYLDSPPQVGPGDGLVASFRFQMPYLPTGDYSVCAGLADGTQADHVQHHWIDDALFFRVDSSHVVRGLVGIPMMGISLERQAGATEGDGLLPA